MWLGLNSCVDLLNIRQYLKQMPRIRFKDSDVPSKGDIFTKKTPVYIVLLALGVIFQEIRFFV